MRHAGALKEVEGPVDGGWLGGLTVRSKGGDQVIGLYRLPGPEKQFQNPPAWRRQPLAGLNASPLGPIQGGLESGAAEAVGPGLGVGAGKRHDHQLIAGAASGKA